MTACQDVEVLLTLRATGDLDDAESRRLELHLAACARCRAEADADAALLRQVRLPPPGAAEARATATLARSTLAELHRREGRATARKRVIVGVAAAAAILVAVLTPALLGRRAVAPPAGVSYVATASAAASWEEPDLDTAWSDTAVLDDDASVTADDLSDAAVASLEL